MSEAVGGKSDPVEYAQRAQSRYGPSHRTLLLVVADGVRHDVLQEEIDAGHLPTLAALRNKGGLYAVSSCFPSVTGSGYVPFLTGRFPGAAGLPGLRWFDRTRRKGFWPAYSRSYAGIDIWFVDPDLDRDIPTLMELGRPSISCMSMLARGADINIGRSVYWMFRAGRAHFSASQAHWHRVDQDGIREFLGHLRSQRPRTAILAMTAPDKRAHREGPHSEGVRAAIREMDDTIRAACDVAERDGWRDLLDVWLVGDHGHATVTEHDDLHGWLESRGLRVRAHPQVYRWRADVVLMVGGNAMAHLYLDPHQRSRAWWPELSAKWNALYESLLERDSIDLASVAMSANRVRIGSHNRGHAEITVEGEPGDQRWTYRAGDGDPLALGGTHQSLNAQDAWDVCSTTAYPDALVQVSALSLASRSGDIIVSASENWDLRARFEPVKHVSTHGALLRDQMLVPLLVDRPVARTPQRTADVMPSALELLDIRVPTGLDGRSFL